MDKILNNEIVDSAKKTIKDKFDSSLYGTFIVYWLIFHWRFVYTIFFTSEDLMWQSKNLFKNDYLVQEFFNYKTLEFWFWWLVPIIFTILTIWVFPRLFVIKAYKREQDDEYTKMIFKIHKEIELESEKAKLQEQKSKKVAAIAEQKQSEKVIKESDPTVQWEEEYKELKSKNLFSHFRTLYQIVYENDGGLYGQQNYKFAMPLIAYLDSTEALDLGGGRIDLTPKGNFFMKKYIQELP